MIDEFLQHRESIRQRLNEISKRLALIRLAHFKRDCDCEWCAANRAFVHPDRLKYYLNYCIETEQYEVAGRVQKEIDSRTEEYTDEYKERVRARIKAFWENKKSNV